MAIKQSITNLSGTKTEYHRISYANIDYTERRAIITVSSYINASKRGEEKSNVERQKNLLALQDELNALVEEPTESNKDRRVELTNAINEMLETAPITEEDLASREVQSKLYTIFLPANTDFNLEFAYNWLKENIYPNAQDC